MKKIELYVPSLEEYWYQEEIQSDSNTMNYNAGYDVSYYGYHYDTGCIDFPKEKWEEKYNKRKIENEFFAYIKDIETNEFVGYCGYHYNKNENRYDCDVLIEAKYREKGYAKEALKLLCCHAENNGIKCLYDNFEIDRKDALQLFKSMGFEIVDELTWLKFNEEVKGVLIKKDL